jgi:hypothetical protein
MMTTLTAQMSDLLAAIGTLDRVGAGGESVSQFPLKDTGFLAFSGENAQF